VQFLESSIVGLRSAIHELASPKYGVNILLLPMVHIGDAAFYATVRDQLSRCDVLIVEGVHSFRGNLLTLAYRIPVKRKSLGLVLQSNALKRGDFPGIVIHGDMDAESFALSWKKIPWTQRMALLILAPLYGFFLYLFASREYLARGHSVDSLPDRDTTPVREAIVGKRNRHLIEQIESYLEEAGDSVRKVAILFGGAHMPAVAKILMSQHGYRVTHSEWIIAIAAAA
jgi:hypothetical protein